MSIKTTFNLFILFLCLCSLHTALANPQPLDALHTAWNDLLKKYVVTKETQSLFNYQALLAEPADKTKLDHYLLALSETKKKTFDQNEKTQQIAFLINAYNALTIKLILKHYPVKSIKKIGGLFSSPWGIKFFKLFEEDHTLDQIEHEILRKQFQEPRIHFALVCASISCPALRNEAYLSSKLETQLENAAFLFLTDLTQNYFEEKSNTLYLSSIFKWYGEDFNQKYGSAVNYISSKMTDNLEQQQKIKNSKIKYLDYNWSLNEPLNP